MSSWTIDPKTGDYVMGLNGAPQDTESLLAPSYIRLKVKRTQWLYAPDDQFGSDFYLQQKRRSTQNASLFEAIAERALQPIADDGRASVIEVTARVATRNAVGMEIGIVDAAGRTERVVIDSLGV